MRTSHPLALLAPQVVALRRSGATVRAIADRLGVSASGIQGLLARLGWAGERPARSRLTILPRKTQAALGLLTHPRARRLTLRERVVLQGVARGLGYRAIAESLGVRPTAISASIAAARARLARPWRRRSRARRAPPLDPAVWASLLGEMAPPGASVADILMR